MKTIKDYGPVIVAVIAIIANIIIVRWQHKKNNTSISEQIKASKEALDRQIEAAEKNTLMQIKANNEAVNKQLKHSALNQEYLVLIEQIATLNESAAIIKRTRANDQESIEDYNMATIDVGSSLRILLTIVNVHADENKQLLELVNKYYGHRSLKKRNTILNYYRESADLIYLLTSEFIKIAKSLKTLLNN